MTGALEEFLRKKERKLIIKIGIKDKFSIPLQNITQSLNNYSSAKQYESQFRSKLPHIGENI